MTQANTHKRIVVVGSTNADIATSLPRIPGPGETLLGSEPVVSPGGKGANQAVSAALLGGNVAFVGAVGKDDQARVATSLMREAGVNLDGLAELDAPTGAAWIMVDEQGENSIVVLSGANAHVHADLVEAQAPTIAAAGVVVLQGEIPVDGIVRAVELARGGDAAGASAEQAGPARPERNPRIIVNLAPVIEVPAATLLEADPLIVNEHEALLVLDQVRAQRAGAHSDQPAPADAAEPEAIVAALRREGFRSVVLTLGKAGAMFGDDRGVVAVASPKVQAVDSTGAGDAFVGAFAAQLASGADPVSAVRFAARVGAFAVTKHGTQTSYPHEGEALPEVQEADQ